MKLYLFTERNSWERERWNFFVRMTDEQASALQDLISGDNSYSLAKSDMTEPEVAERVARSLCRGYMPSWNDAGTMVQVPPKTGDHPADQLYKGKICDFCIAEKEG